MAKNLFIVQGGGPTTVINASLGGILEEAAIGGHARFDRVYGLRHSFEGAGSLAPIDLTRWLEKANPKERISQFAHTPGAFLGSSREPVTDKTVDHVLSLLQQASASSLIGIGGNGTMHALSMIAKRGAESGYPISVVGVPKTVDNDLHGVHVAPGFASAARFVALVTRDVGLDFLAMSTFDNVTILETMGRNSGWLAAASTILKETDDDPPHIVCTPERPFDETGFLGDVKAIYDRLGRVFVVVNEVLRDAAGAVVGEAVQVGPRDRLGRVMYSLSTGTGQYLAELIWKTLGLQTRCLRPGIIGRSLSVCVSPVDRKLAWRLGREACRAVAAGQQDIMIGIDGDLNPAPVPLADGAGRERRLPEEFLSDYPPYITTAFRDYAGPLIGPVESVATYIET